MTAPSKTGSLKDIAFADLERELATTRRVLERLPEEHYAWKPHEKSMNLGRLAQYLSELFGKFTSYFFIRIQRKNVISGCLLDRGILLCGVTLPSLDEHLGSE